MQIQRNKIVSINELAPITFTVPPEPPAYVQTVDPKQVAANTTFKDYYKSNIKTFDTKINDSFLTRAAKYIGKNEGKKNYLYKDSKGYWTIGIGHLVTKDELPLYQGRVLTDDEVYEIFNKDLQKKLKLVKRDFPQFDSYSEDLKIAILDGYFRGDLSGSPKTREHIRAGNFQAAAKEYLNNREYKAAVKSGSGVAKRMKQNAAIFANQT